MPQQRSEETRLSILQAAGHCFAEHGYDATGVAEICACAGISKGAFYYHFESKQAVFLALLETWLSELNAALDSVVDASLPVSTLIMNMMYVAQSAFESNVEQVPLILEFWAQAGRNAAVQAASLETYRHYHTFMVGLIQRGIDEGVFSPMDASAGAQVMLSLASGLLFQGLLDPCGADWGNVAENCVQILFNGLRRRSE